MHATHAGSAAVPGLPIVHCHGTAGRAQARAGAHGTARRIRHAHALKSGGLDAPAWLAGIRRRRRAGALSDETEDGALSQKFFWRSQKWVPDWRRS